MAPNEEKIVLGLGLEGTDPFVTGLEKATESTDALGKSIIDLINEQENEDRQLKANIATINTAAKSEQEFRAAIIEVTTAIKEQSTILKDTVTEQRASVVATEEQVKALQEENAELTRNIESLRSNNLEIANRVKALEAEKVAQEESTAATKLGTKAGADAAAGLSSTYDRLGKLSKMGTPAILKAATWGGLALGGIAYESVKQFSSLNAELTQSITQAGRAANSMPFLQSTALQVSQQTGASFKDVGNMIYRVASATANWNGGLGATNVQLAQMTRQVANLNVLGGVAGGAPAEQSARVLGALLNTNLPGVGTSPEAAAALINAATGAGDIKQSELVSALGRGLLTAAAAHGISGASTMSFVDLLTTQGTPGSTAGQYAKTAFTLMTAPSSQGAKALSMIGIEPGTLNTILKQPNGIVAAAQYMHDALSRFNPTAFNVKYKGATGAVGATALLENWGVGDIPQQVINAWASGNLANLTAAQLGTEHAGKGGTAVTGADWLSTLQNLIITKAFGGSRSSATIDALVNNPQAVANIYDYINKHSSTSTYRKDVALAESTPQAQFNRMKQSFMADLINIGQALTPWALRLGNAFKDVVGAIVKFKPLLVVLASGVASLALLAGIAKAAAIGQGAIRLIGSGYNMTTGFWKKRGVVTEEDIAAGNRRGVIFGGGKIGQRLGGIATAYETESLGVLKEIAMNTGRSAAEGAMGSMGGAGRGVKALEGEAMQGLESEAMSYGPHLSELQHGPLLSEIRPMSKMEEYASLNPNARMPRKLKKLYQSLDAEAEAKRLSSNEVKRVAGEGEKLITAPGLKETIVKTAATDAEKGIVSVAEKGALRGAMGVVGDVAGSALGFLGGPVGMMAMSMLLPMAMPYIGKAIGAAAHFFGGLFGGNAPKPVVTTGGKNNAIIQSSLAGLQGELAGGKATMALYESQFAKGDYSNLSKYEALKANMATWTSQLSLYGPDGKLKNISATGAQGKQGKQQLAQLQAFSAMIKATSGLEGSIITDKIYNQTGATLRAQLKKAGYSGSVANAIMNAYKSRDWSTLQADLTGTKSNILSGIMQNQAGVMANDPNFFNRMYAKNLVYGQTHFGGSSTETSDKTNMWLLGQRMSGLSYDQAQHRVLQLGEAGQRYQNQAIADKMLAEAAAKHGDTATAKTLTDASKHLQDLAIEFKLRAYNQSKYSNLHPQDMKTLADLIVSGTAASNSQLGLTSAGIQAAFAGALGPGGMKGLVNSINKAITTGRP